MTMRSSRSSLTVILLCGTLTAVVLGQTGHAPAPKTPAELVLENDYVRVFRQPVDAGEVPVRADQSRDAAIVRLTGVAPDSEEQVTFVSRDSRRAIAPAGSPYTALVIELKRHWAAEVRPCAEPMVCSRKITAGGLQVGETRFLFTNGFVSAYRHHLVPGGTLASSYYSSSGTNRILVVALTDLHINLGGIDETLGPGQVYFSDRTEAQVNAVGHAAAWVVVRFLTQK